MVAAIASIGLLTWALSATDRPHPSSILLLYVGAEDCAPCRVWQSGDGATFLASAEFARISYREVKSPRLFDVLKDENWPDDIRSYRDHLRRGDGVPLWLIVSDDRIVEQRSGATQWQATVLPKIKSLLR